MLLLGAQADCCCVCDITADMLRCVVKDGGRLRLRLGAYLSGVREREACSPTRAFDSSLPVPCVFQGDFDRLERSSDQQFSRQQYRCTSTPNLARSVFAGVQHHIGVIVARSDSLATTSQHRAQFPHRHSH